MAEATTDGGSVQEEAHPQPEPEPESQEKHEEKASERELHRQSASAGDEKRKKAPGAYFVSRTLGSGPFSRVELWVDRDNVEAVVAKTITTDLDAGKFAQAARELTRLKHPSVLQTLGFVPQTASSQATLLTTHADRRLWDVQKVGVKLPVTERVVILVGV